MRSTTILGLLVSMAVATPQNFGLQGLDLGSAFNNNFGLEGQNSFGLSGLEGKDSFGLNGFSEIGQKIEESKADNFKSYGSGDFYGSNGQNLLKNLKNLNSKSFGQNFGKGSDFGVRNGLSFGF